MKKLIAFICLALSLSACQKDDEFKRELVISAQGILSGGDFEYLDDSDGFGGYGYSVYLHRGKIAITDEVLDNPISGSYKHSRGIFFEVVDDGEYTVIVDVSYLRDGVFGSSYYSGMAYTTIKYPKPDLGKTFIFNWDNEISNYEEDGVTYVNLRPPYPTY